MGDATTHALHLQRVLGAIRSEKILIAANVNGVSPLRSARTNETDEDVEDIIAQFDLVAVHQPGQPCTFVKGERDIDVILATMGLANKIKSWAVMEDATSSDHRAICTEFEYTTSEVKTAIHSARYNIKRARWKAYEAKLAKNAQQLMSLELRSPEDDEDLAQRVTLAMTQAACRTLPKTKWCS